MIDYSLLQFKKQFRKPAVHKKPYQILGWDTETIDGKAWLITCSDNTYMTNFSIDDIFSYLTRKSVYQCTNFLWNLDYDFFAILKHLPEKNIHELNYFGKTIINNTKIRYIPKKFFSISKNHRTSKFYDLYQFYNLSLNSASEKYLNKQKLEIDTDNLNNPEYVKNNIEKIIDYSINDSVLCAELGKLLTSEFKELKIKPKSFYSPAYISTQYFLTHTHIPYAFNTPYQEYAYYSYFGGRFEVFQKGYFDNVYCYDINSAYPYQIANLLDINRGTWIKSTTIPENAYYGFIKCRISYFHKYITPLPIRNNSIVYFPNLKPVLKYITLNEYKYITENNLGKIDIINGYFFIPNDFYKPFNTITKLYNIKNQLKHTDPAKYEIYKLIMNSFYGKTLEKKVQLKHVNKCEPDKEYIDIFNIDNDGTYEKQYITGNFFNPAYASIITSNCRLQILEMLLKHQDTAIATFTDSFITNEKKDYMSNEIGKWNFKRKGEAIILGSGVYTIRNNEKITTHLRGFIFNKNIDLFSLLEAHRTRTNINLMQTKTAKLKACIKHKNLFNLHDLNKFIHLEKYLNINFDKKRNWDRPFDNCNDVLNNSINSIPLFI